MNNILIVGLGGAIGAAGRYLISLLPVKTSFPALTLITNLIGAVLIGFITGIAVNKGIREKWILFWKTGVSGGFTTFSAFSLESFSLIKGGKSALGVIYISISVFLCILGVAAGQYIGGRTFKGI